jgi:4-hydroxy-4-methyl-2-oxoglutarate aldolase
MREDMAPQFGALSTTAVSDALDRLGIAGQAEGIKPLDCSFRMVGRAFTIRYQPVDVNGGTVGDYIDDVPPGAVVALDNAGRLDATVWGDLLTTVAHARGLAGTVIDGVCRDSSRSLELGYPIFSRSSYMRTGKDRVQVAAVGDPVTIGRVRVRPDDIIVADADGVVVVPSERAAEVLEAAQDIERAEQGIRALILAGRRLDEARVEFGYHGLQHHSTG